VVELVEKNFRIEKGGKVEKTEYAPLNLWIREDQMEKITKDAYEKSVTIYHLIREMIDFYYEHQGNNGRVDGE
jgi:hypothetical protein